MTQRITPPFGVTGFWKLREPYRAKPAKTYTCTAIRSFVELELININIHYNYYAPHELGIENYQRDLALGASLVVLLGTDGERIYVPDTYIESYPDMDIGNFRRFILSCELGTLPVNTPTDHLTSAISAIVQEKLGRAVTVNTYIGPITPNGLTPTDLKREENARLSGVTDKTTMYGQLYEANRRLGDLEGLLQVYKEQLKEKDLAVHRAEELTKQNEILTKENQTLTQTNSQQVSTIQTLTESEATLTERIGRLEQTIRQLGGVIPN